MISKKIKLIFVFFIFASFCFLTSNSLAANNDIIDNIPTNTGLPDPGGDDPVITVAENFMNWLLALIGILGVIAFSISGIQYLTAAGNDKQIEIAKRNMIWSVVGILVALIGLVVLITIDGILNGNI